MDNTYEVLEQDGETLRDKFAITALQGILIDPNAAEWRTRKILKASGKYDDSELVKLTTVKLNCALAYVYADEMLKTRKEGQNE